MLLFCVLLLKSEFLVVRNNVDDSSHFCISFFLSFFTTRGNPMLAAFTGLPCSILDHKITTAVFRIFLCWITVWHARPQGHEPYHKELPSLDYSVAR